MFKGGPLFPVQSHNTIQFHGENMPCQQHPSISMDFMQENLDQYDQGWSLLNKWQIIVTTIFQVFSGRMCRIPHINGWLEFAPSVILRAIAIQEAMKSGVNTFQQQKHYRQWRRLRTWKKPRQCCSPIVLTWRQTACNDGMKLSNGNWESMA